MKYHHALIFLIIGNATISLALLKEPADQIPASKLVIHKKKFPLLQNTMRRFQTALYRYKLCLVKHEGCTPHERALILEATNLLLEQILIEVVYAGATIGKKITQ